MIKGGETVWKSLDAFLVSAEHCETGNPSKEAENRGRNGSFQNTEESMGVISYISQLIKNQYGLRLAKIVWNFMHQLGV